LETLNAFAAALIDLISPDLIADIASNMLPSFGLDGTRFGGAIAY
jgi:hypothetical protein